MTVISAVPLFPSVVAVMVAGPAATPVTRPELETVAIAVFELDHATERPVSVPPLASLRVTESWAVLEVSIVAAVGATLTVATGSVLTVTVADPLLPSLVAEMLADPTATPVI